MTGRKARDLDLTFPLPLLFCRQSNPNETPILFLASCLSFSITHFSLLHTLFFFFCFTLSLSHSFDPRRRRRSLSSTNFYPPFSLLVFLLASSTPPNLISPPPVLSPILRKSNQFPNWQLSLPPKFHGPDPPFVHLCLFTGFAFHSYPHSLFEKYTIQSIPF